LQQMQRQIKAIVDAARRPPAPDVEPAVAQIRETLAQAKPRKPRATPSPGRC
jgi:hypothetical protein